MNPLFSSAAILPGTALTDSASELAGRIASLDPTVIGDAARLWPLWMAALLFVVGIYLAGFGSRGVGRRLTIGALAAIAGASLTGLLPPWVPGRDVPAVLAVAFGILGMLSPAAGAGAAGAFAGAWIAHRFPSGDHRGYVQLGCGLALAVALACANRWIAAVATAVAGSIVMVTAGISLLPTPLQASLASYPAAPLLPMVVIACAGAAFQLARPSPEKRKAGRSRRGEDDPAGAEAA